MNYERLMDVPLVVIGIILVVIVLRIVVGQWRAESKERKAQKKKAAAKASSKKTVAVKRNPPKAPAQNVKPKGAANTKQPKEQTQNVKTAEILKAYSAAFDRHAALVKEIQALYSNTASDPNQEKLIALLREDISLVPAFVDCNNQMKLAGLNMESDLGMKFDPFARLADLYESKGQYQQALGVCKDAVALGVAPEENQRHIEILKGKLVQKNG